MHEPLGGLGMERDFLFTAQGKGLRDGDTGHETGDEHGQGQRSRAGPVRPCRWRCQVM